MDTRWNEIRKIWQSNPGLYAVVGFIIGLIFSSVLQSAFSDVGKFLADLGPEAVGILVTIFVIDRLYQLRDEQQLRRRLIAQMGSKVNAVALSAVEELWARGWLRDGSLNGAQLARADLRGADLGKANLTGAKLEHKRYGTTKFDTETRLPDDTFWYDGVDMAQFTNADHKQYWRGFNLRGANLERSREFTGKNLRGADLLNTNLRGADMTQANLEGAEFGGAHLEGTNFTGANLHGATFDHEAFGLAQFSADTILPDGAHYDMAGGLVQLQRFTNTAEA